MLTTLQVQVCAADVTVGDIETSAVRAAGETRLADAAACPATIVTAFDTCAVRHACGVTVGVGALLYVTRDFAGSEEYYKSHRANAERACNWTYRESVLVHDDLIGDCNLIERG